MPMTSAGIPRSAGSSASDAFPRVSALTGLFGNLEAVTQARKGGNDILAGSVIREDFAVCTMSGQRATVRSFRVQWGPLRIS